MQRGFGLTEVQAGEFKEESGQQCQVFQEGKKESPGDSLLDLAMKTALMSVMRVELGRSQVTGAEKRVGREDGR